MNLPHDVARIRLDNALLLFDEFVRVAAATPDAATLRGLERRFAERLQIQPSYWSQIKGRSRQIGERLARQFEQLCRKPNGWMDLPHLSAAAPHHAPSSSVDAAPTAEPADDDERFIVGLVLTYYRRHPQRARTRLLDLLGEVLTAPADSAHPGAKPLPPNGAKTKSVAPPQTDERALWARSASGVAPLKRKR